MSESLRPLPPLFHLLAGWRNEEAECRYVPRYLVQPDRRLALIAHRSPDVVRAAWSYLSERRRGK